MAGVGVGFEAGKRRRAEPVAPQYHQGQLHAPSGPWPYCTCGAGVQVDRGFQGQASFLYLVPPGGGVGELNKGGSCPSQHSNFSSQGVPKGVAGLPWADLEFGNWGGGLSQHPSLSF